MGKNSALKLVVLSDRGEDVEDFGVFEGKSLMFHAAVDDEAISG